MLLLLAGQKPRQKALPLADCSQRWWTAQKQAQPTFLDHHILKGRSALHDAVDGGTMDHKEHGWAYVLMAIKSGQTVSYPVLRQIAPSSHHPSFKSPVRSCQLDQGCIGVSEAQPTQSLICLNDSLQLLLHCQQTSLMHAHANIDVDEPLEAWSLTMMMFCWCDGPQNAAPKLQLVHPQWH